MSKRILVVEDQPDNRQIIRDMLAPTDYEITEAENGEEALASIAKQRPDLILMDIPGKMSLEHVDMNDVSTPTWARPSAHALRASIDAEKKKAPAPSTQARSARSYSLLANSVGRCWVTVAHPTSSVARTPMAFQWRTSRAMRCGRQIDFVAGGHHQSSSARLVHAAEPAGEKWLAWQLFIDAVILPDLHWFAAARAWIAIAGDDETLFSITLCPQRAPRPTSGKSIMYDFGWREREVSKLKDELEARRGLTA